MNNYLFKCLGAIWLLILGIFCTNVVVASTSGYDGEAQGQIEYDASCSNFAFGYDGRALLAKSENNGYSVATPLLLGEFAGFLAAGNGTANLYYYSPESLGQDLPHFSVETFGENGMSTHQVITGPNSTTVVLVENLPAPTATISIPLSDPAAAQAMQAQQLGADLGAYCPRNNSCLTTAADVLRAGGADVPASNVQLRTWVKAQIQQQ